MTGTTLNLHAHVTGHQTEVTSVRLAGARELLHACLYTADQIWPRQTRNLYHQIGYNYTFSNKVSLQS